MYSLMHVSQLGFVAQDFFSSICNLKLRNYLPSDGTFKLQQLLLPEATQLFLAENEKHILFNSTSLSKKPPE